jgi:hypothetical protein
MPLLRLVARLLNNPHYTPKSASWLNMIEIEFSAIARQCLNRRIPTVEMLRSEVLALAQARDAQQIQIDW